MSTDRTQHQSQSEVERAKRLSLRSSRPPVDLPGYDTDRLIGAGAFGEVWIGVDRNTGRQVAIKFYTQRSRLDWTQLSREVEKLVFLSADRYVVQLLDVGWDSDPPYYVMEYVEGGSLEDMLREHGSIPVADAVEMFREIATALIHAHGKGVLHCDLKPANILLDQDFRPRLADFGQSRLSHEQSPALGTLFYMAPEQADLDAVPDARWDVYALGAILYCLLTGVPPHRSQEVVEELDSISGLTDRLAQYRRVIQAAATPAAHRRVRGVDRILADIVDRCLAVEPARRFANVQSVIDAVQRRDEVRVRNPLMVLGFLGPIVLLVIMAIFGLRGYRKAMTDSERFISEQAAEAGGFAAQLAARAIENEIAKYRDDIQDEALGDGLLELFRPVVESEIVQQLNDANLALSDQNFAVEPMEDLRKQFAADPTRVALNQYLSDRLQSYSEENKTSKLTSLLVVDRKGRMLAVAYHDQRASKSIGWNYSYRTYFHGGPSDLKPSNGLRSYQQIHDVEPIRSSHFSAAFRSTTSEFWKVAISTPVLDSNQEVIGVIAFTMNVGDFAYLRDDNQKEPFFAVVIDGRGVVLRHPHFDYLSQIEGGLAKNYTDDFRVSADQLATLRAEDKLHLYHDPLVNAAGGTEFSGDWIAAIARVQLPNQEPGDEDMLVLVQEKVQHATRPVKDLGVRLKNEGIWALSGVVAVTLVLWYIVLRMLNEPRNVLTRRSNGAALPTTSQQLTTLEPQTGNTEAAS